MSKRPFRYVVPAILVLSLVGASLAIAAGQGPKGPKSSKGHGHGSSSTGAVLSGRQEVPAIHTSATGRLKLTMTNSTTFSYELTYSGLSGDATAAHIHFGQFGANGGVLVDLCGGTKPACPLGTSGTVTGTIMGTDVKGIQGFTAGDFAGFVDELKAGFLYANVHTAMFGSGQIRGQIGSVRDKHFGSKWGRGHDKDDDD